MDPASAGIGFVIGLPIGAWLMYHFLAGVQKT